MGVAMVNYYVIEITRQDLVGGGGRPSPRPAVFVAYDFDSPQSEKFRLDLEADIRRTSALATIDILDGHSFVGEYWPKEVRRNLKRAKLTIADLSVLNRDVLFECGFAWGLGRPILPVAFAPESHTRMPSWFTDIQFGHYSTVEGKDHILNSLAHHLKKQSRSKGRVGGRVKGNPCAVAIIGGELLDPSVIDRVRAACNQYGMDVPCEIRDASSLESVESHQVDETVQASLFVGLLNGGTSDTFLHFAAGAILSAPTSGGSKARLQKLVLLVVPDETDKLSMTPTSARKVKEVRVVTPQQLHNELVGYGQRYENWRNQ
jgi:hypothetical protein